MVGIDLLKSSRFEKKSKSFFQKYFTDNEINYAKTRKCFSETICGIFASKEAFFKALGIGILNGFSMKDVEVLHDINGAPILKISSEIKKKFKIKKISLSISHDSDFAIAICQIN